MFAIIKLSGLQHVVKKGDVITVNKLDTEGDDITITDVLATCLEPGKLVVGAPFVEGAKVTAKVLNTGKGPKVTIFKKKRRHNYRKKVGFRPQLTTLEIVEIV